MINRRKFLKLSTATLAVTPLLIDNTAHGQQQSLTTGGKDYSYLSGTERDSIATSCALCTSHCPAIAYIENDQVVKIEGQPDSQRTLGKLCAKGQAGVNQIYDPDRILQPMKRVGKRGEGQWQEITWDDALSELTDRMKKLRDEGHAEKFMFHHGEISASADKLINKIFLANYGTNTIASNSGLGQSARHTAHELTWGGYQDSWDFENSRYVLNFGSNVMEAGSNHVALARRLSYALTDSNLKMVTFDVRLSNTASKSHSWIQVKPGTDAAIVLAMCNVVMKEKLYRGQGEEFLKFCQLTPNPDASINEKIAALTNHLHAFAPAWAEKISGVSAQQIRDIAFEFATAKPACIISARSASGHYNGVETERAIQMLAAITGNIDNPGGRCIGVAPEWKYPTGPKDKPMAKRLNILEDIEGQVALPIHGVSHQVLKMIQDGQAGRPEIYMWYNYNPVLANSNIQENLDILKDESLLPYTVAVTPFYDESAAVADLILPDAMYLESFNFEDRISPTQIAEYSIRQAVVKPQGNARDFQDVCCELAEKMGFPLGFVSAESFVEQSCDLTDDIQNKAGGFAGMKQRGVWQDPAAKSAYYSYKKPVSATTLKKDGVIFDAASGVYWNWKNAGVKNEREALSKGYRNISGAYKGYIAQKIAGAIYTGFRPDKINKSGYFELYSPILKEKGFPPLPSYSPVPEHQALQENEFILTTFRINVHTLSRTQNCRWLDEISNENAAWINPKTALTQEIKDGDKIMVRSQLGEIESTARVTYNVVPGVIAMSCHGGHWEYGRYASGKKAPYSVDLDTPYEELKWWKNNGANPNWIIENSSEPISGQQRWMDTVVTISSV